MARLAAVARHPLQEWSLRRCAALMLEHLFWACESPAAEAVILSHLEPSGRTIDAGELRRRIARNARVHAGLQGTATPPEALADFLHLATRESRLTLMRWLFTPDEVIARITGAMRGSRAAIRRYRDLPWISSEAARALARLPKWERRIARSLASARRAFWVSEETGSSPGDLLEYPAGTVVLTVKPPGGDLEIEIKRAGRPRPRPLAVVWEQDGQPVPSSHRLDGGQMGDMARWEAASAARLSIVWRALHGEEAPLSLTLAVKSLQAVPDGERELPVLDFFTQEAAQPALAQVVAMVCAEKGEELPDLSRLAEDVALAAHYLRQASPVQCVILGTSAHRLDKVAGVCAPRPHPRPLSRGERGGLAEEVELVGCAERTINVHGAPSAPYGNSACRSHPSPPGRGAGGEVSKGTRPQTSLDLADLLDEILGLFTPPAIPFTDPATWLDAAFAANRQRADACHRAAAERLGSLWGTFLALGAHSSGESLVGRNVGLKAMFRDGDWKVDLISMDHDNLHVAWSNDEGIHPAAVLAANVKDEIALLGGPYKGVRVRGSLELLGDLYRADEAERTDARARFFAAAREAFVRSSAALEPGGAAAGLFTAAFLAELRRWQRAVAEFLTHGALPEDRPEWAAAIGKHAGFLQRQSGVYLGES